MSCVICNVLIPDHRYAHVRLSRDCYYDDYLCVSCVETKSLKEYLNALGLWLDKEQS